MLTSYLSTLQYTYRVQQRNATQNKLAKHFNFLNNLSIRQNHCSASTQFLQWSKDSLKGLQTSTIVLECHRSGLYHARLCYLGLHPTRTVSCEMDHLDRCRSTSTHFSHCNLEFFDYSVVKVQNKKPETLFTKQFGNHRQFITRHVAYAASHNGINKLPSEKSSRYMLLWLLVLRYMPMCKPYTSTKTFYHRFGFMDTAISNHTLINIPCNWV